MDTWCSVVGLLERREGVGYICGGRGGKVGKVGLSWGEGRREGKGVLGGGVGRGGLAREIVEGASTRVVSSDS